MDCGEARRLLDAGVRPGSTDPRRAALGFHLARCATCRAYAASPGDAGLLAALFEEAPPAAILEETPPPPPVDRGAAGRPGPPRMLGRRGPRPWVRYAVLGALTLIFGALAVGVGRLAVAAYTITDNLSAMQVTAAPTVVGTPQLVVPATPPPPSPLPAEPTQAAPSAPPAAGVLDAPTASRPSTAPATAAPTSSAVPQVSATPLRLPQIGGPAALPTLMATVDVLPAVASGEPVNILLLGSDRRPGESWQTRSDAIMVVRLEPARQRVALLSLPRDLIVSIPGYGQARINAATVYGEMYPELGGGTELARQTVSQLLGIPIDHVLRADFNAFTTAIDAIGGVDINVEQELYDPQYPTMDYGYMEAYFPVGVQHMDGNTALIYSRMRHMDSNYARNRRQQQVILAILHRVRDQNVLGQVQMLADLTSALRDDIQTDLSLDQMVGLAWAFRGFSPDLVERYALDENLVYEGGIPGDPYATLPVEGGIEIIVNQLLNGGQ
jgi:LCP family protein required for cell wall assembly